VRRILITFLLCGCSLWAQQGTSVSTRSAVDINGSRVTDGPQVIQTKSANATETTETMQSVNGRMVPLQRIEERVVRDDASGKVTERIIRRYDAQGNPTTPMRQTIEEKKRPDGSSTTLTTTYSGDINGGMQLREKSMTETQKDSSGERAETIIQRPTLNGSLETIEKETKVNVKESNGYREETTTYRQDGNGGFYAAVRKSTEHVEQGSQATENIAQYEAAAGGSLQLHSQTVSKTVAQPDGSKDQVVDLYGQSVPGTVASTGLKLQERQLIQAKQTARDTVVQTVSVQRPSISDPNSLSAPREISQTVCKGNCKP
jgi:hypothetical protein